jgi:site-specific recombinase XerC
VVLDASAACVHLHGKGRKQRSVPLWRSTVKAIRAWLHVNPQFEARRHCCRIAMGKR